MLVDALVLPHREDQRVRAEAGFVAIGVDAAGYREILGLRLGDSESEARWVCGQRCQTHLTRDVLETAPRALRITDTASAGETVWFDNVQVWDVPATGQASMPYCELRFPQSPCTLIISGLQGDLPAPVHLALGTQVSAWGPGSTPVYAAGRRGCITA